MTRVLMMAYLGLGALVLAGCERKAEGQVAAVVNGEEITLSEVNAELGDAQIPEGAAKSTARQAALQRIVQRRLLAQAAREDGLDKSPEFLIRRRALEDALLVQLLAKKIGSTIKVPASSEIDATISARPEQFANRSILTVDRIQFVPSGSPALLAALEGAQSLDAIERVLKDSKIAFARGAAEIDTAQLNAEVAKQFMALPDGEPFILPQGGIYTAGVVTGKRTVPIVGEQAGPIAVRAMRAEQLNKAVERRLSAALSQAEIEYQPGFAPPEADAAGKRSN